MSAHESSLMQGMSENRFEANSKLTRAMFITVMHRMSNLPKVDKKSVFMDADSGVWYADAVVWGYESKIISGNDVGNILPQNYASRAETATMILKTFDTKNRNAQDSELYQSNLSLPSSVIVSQSFLVISKIFDIFANM